MSRRPGGKPALAGRRILVTRSREQAASLADLLIREGAEVPAIPLIRFAPPDSWEAADRAIGRLDRYARIVFTSANGVEFFFRRLAEQDANRRLPSGVVLAAIGPQTAEALAARGLQAQVIPETFLSEGLAEALAARELAGREILIPRAQEAREALVEALESRGAQVTVAPVYRTVPVEESRGPLTSILESGRVDLAAFTSASAVNVCVDLLGEKAGTLLSSVRVACLGPVTAQAARSRGIRADVVPERSTIPDLAAAIVRFFAGGRG